MKALVTGGGGFLGSAIVRRLIARGDTVRTFQRGYYPELEKLGVECIRGDLNDRVALRKADGGVDVIFHVAAKAGVWGNERGYVYPNYYATSFIAEFAFELGIKRLIYTSSPSVVFNGTDENGIDESTPYPAKCLANYPKTKSMAENYILAVNSPAFATIALRPHLIWGPGDPHLVPRIIARAKAGRLRIVGNGQNLVDSTYIDNAADAHLLAADRLFPGAPCAGKAYFLSNGEPLPIADLINRILAAAGMPSITCHISAKKAYALGAFLEGTYKLLGKKSEPPMTRFVARQLSTAHWFNLDAIKRDLGYHPTVSIDEGMRRLTVSLGNPQ